MNVVIQCAARKHPGGSLQTEDGKRVIFVADPKLASEFVPLPSDCIYARPDDPCLDGTGESWRDRLQEYVSRKPQNPLGLLPACELYNPSSSPLVYKALARRFGGNAFILSAGWGLIRADYPTPTYNITFSKQANKSKPWAYCGRRTGYRYFQQIQPGQEGPVVFVGGLDYLPLLRSLVEPLHCRTIVFTKSGLCAAKARNRLPRSWEIHPFHSPHTRTWHYECAEALAKGNLNPL